MPWAMVAETMATFLAISRQMPMPWPHFSATMAFYGLSNVPQRLMMGTLAHGIGHHGAISRQPLGRDSAATRQGLSACPHLWAMIDDFPIFSHHC